jgi:nucleotide-binding universal stress UspA family protein
MSLNGPVLVATDLSESADEALRQADALARHAGGALRVCHVLPEMLRVRMLFPQLQLQDAYDIQALEREAADVVAARVRDLTGRSAADYAVEIDAGSPHAGILQAAERIQAGILVVGPGSVAERVARSAACHVLVARPSPSGKVLGATDLSDPSFPAVEAAVTEASRRGVPLCLVHSVDLRPIQWGAMPMAFPAPAVSQRVVDELRADVLGRLQSCLERFGAEGERLVVDGPAATAIVEVARELPAELVVVGTRGRTGLSRLALGSVAEAVLSNAPCSVLVVRLDQD